MKFVFHVMDPLCIQKWVLRHKMRCTCVLVFAIRVWGGIPDLPLQWHTKKSTLPNLRQVISELANEKDDPYAIYSSRRDSKIWGHPDFVLIYTHPNHYIEEVIQFLHESGHTTKEHLIVLHMMELLSSTNYARFLEACAESYLANNLSTRMLAEVTRPIRWNIRTRDMPWRPGYFLANYKNPSVQEILTHIQKNIHLPIFFKKCIAGSLPKFVF